MRISDWSSDVCSAELRTNWRSTAGPSRRGCMRKTRRKGFYRAQGGSRYSLYPTTVCAMTPVSDRKSVASGKCGSVRIDRGGRRTSKKRIRRTDQNQTSSDRSYDTTKVAKEKKR